jgi:aminoglycoside phosphotransferase (APT) family kinase protein
MSELAGLDAPAVSGWMGGLELGEATPLRFSRVGNGYSNLTFRAEDAAGARWVLRRPPLGELLESAHDVEREHRILAALADEDVPTPRVLGLCRDPAVSEVPLVLMEHVDGFVLDSEAAVGRLGLDARGRVGRGLAETLARIHAVDLQRSGLATLSASRTPYAARQLRRWGSQWEASKTRELPLVGKVADRLAAAMPPQSETVLVHGDFHLMNALVSADGQVRSVLDWELCTLGDPIADLGGLFAYWPEPGERPGVLFPASAYPGFPSREELAAAYAASSGRSLESLGFWHALGLWKLAIIAEGILRRELSDPRNTSLAGGVSAPLVEELVERASTVAASSGI